MSWWDNIAFGCCALMLTLILIDVRLTRRREAVRLMVERMSRPQTEPEDEAAALLRWLQSLDS